MISTNLNDNAILNIRGFDYRCIINGISKSDAVNLPQNADLTEKGGVLWKLISLKNLLPYIKWVKKL